MALVRPVGVGDTEKRGGSCGPLFGQLHDARPSRLWYVQEWTGYGPGVMWVPPAMEKLEGPTTCLTFLGIKVDTEAMELRLPEKKLQLSLTAAVEEWYSVRAA